MYIGVLQVVLHLPANNNLKGKRRVIKSLTDKIKHRFNVSVAEVAEKDSWQISVLGLSYVSSDARDANKTLTYIRTFIESVAGEFELLDQYQEIISSQKIRS